ncbi:MAG TPA: HTTM domain-containing protein [Gemmatimonadales bacterium]|nr:HTTM domain-containing protein [Gemmatimonadales bacterium]
MTLRERGRAGARNLEARFGTKQRLIGCSLLRLGLGGTVSYIFLSSWQVRHYLWGPAGAMPIDTFGTTDAHLGPSIFAVRSEALFDALYLTGLLVSLVFLVGWKTRLVVFPFVLFTWSLFSRNPLMMNGANVFVAVTLLYVVFLDSSAHLSVDARRRRPPGRFETASAWLHNTSLLCLLVQLCIAYGASFLAKTVGASWRDGSALGTIFSLVEYRPPILAGLLTGSHLLSAAIGYFTMAVEASYPFLVWSRRGRWPALAGALLLHGGTIVFMGLVFFGLTMIAYQAVLLSDDQYRLLVNRGMARSTPVTAS